MSESNEEKTMAYGDESVLLVADPPLYLVGASVFNANADVVRRALERVKPKGAPKLHWRSMTDRQKEGSMAAISSLDHHTTIAFPILQPTSSAEVTIRWMRHFPGGLASTDFIQNRGRELARRSKR